MILDSSAVLAVLLREAAQTRVVARMAGAGRLAIGAPTLFETEMVAISRFTHGRRLVDQFRDFWELEVLAFAEAHRRVAADAFDRYGKGRHPAALNYGDCMTYAAARIAELPLLFTGDDFSRTDLEAAL